MSTSIQENNVQIHPTADQPNPEGPQQEQGSKKKWLIKGAVLLAIGFAIVLVFVFKSEVEEILESFLDWVEKHKVLGPFLLALVYIIAVVFFLPGSILTIGAGLTFKAAYGSTGQALLVGSLAVWIGASIGATVAMLLGRFVFKESVEKLS
mmetsp:Transcript_1872/g.2572  ORF Transcript_1872/g.2572 Transcript_1872/m.2572 type:complete len:151 (+) Transcript_1872:62-514(+)|eukprot:CAMPEP_0170492520 /NCGR_PEP_ID=MMETSP0208-20121228/12374_1 /TAXON_ID=197538 /ORGANISM="Strombidium inclinatum, Strain S3" /LENGTH=150 /DNA_ID=CAMNT_0010768273 /DNA_START=62 /DNA_END=514 /DNA_ORIENTATION=-